MKNFHLIGFVTILLFTFVQKGTAADQSNMFSVKGVGSTTCEQFNHAFKAKDRNLDMYGGWVEGYITALNQTSGETFDLAPWQSTDLLITALAKYCKESPKRKFFDVVKSMVVTLHNDRLNNFSQVKEIRKGNKVLLIYEDIVKKIQINLKRHSFYNGEISGEYDPETEAGVKKFQKSVSTKVTGIPNQKTLVLLFQK